MDTARLSRIKKQLVGEKDGQDVLRLRTAVVSAVNSDGSVDIVLSGVTVAGVPRLGEAAVSVSSVVQVLSYRGSMLVIGTPANGGQSAGLGLWGRAQSGSATSTLTTSLAAVLTTNAMDLVKNRVYEVKTHGAVNSTSANAYLDLRAYRAAAATQIGEFFRFPAPVANVAFNATGGGLYFSPAANVSGATVALYAAGSVVSAVTHLGTTSTPRNVEVYDVGDISQYTGVTAW